MIDIFLSYNEQDRDTARRVVTLLEAGGWSVWWDRRVPAGETWRAVLDRALADMKCMVVLWSRRSVESEWVCEEASEGRRLGRLVPVMIEPVRPPAGFREIQAADLSGWDGSVTHPSAEALLADIRSRLGAQRSNLYSDQPPLKPDALSTAEQRIAAGPSELGPPPDAIHRTVDSRIWIWLAGATALVATGVLAWWMARPPPEPAAATRTDTSRPAPATVDRAAEQVRIEKPATTSTPDLNPAPATMSSDSSRVLRENVRPPVSPSNKTKVRGSSVRCSALLDRLQLGEPLSDSDRAVLQKECPQ